MSDIKVALERWANDISRHPEHGYVPTHTAGEMLELLWPVIAAAEDVVEDAEGCRDSARHLRDAVADLRKKVGMNGK